MLAIEALRAAQSATDPLAGRGFSRHQKVQRALPSGQGPPSCAWGSACLTRGRRTLLPALRGEDSDGRVEPNGAALADVAGPKPGALQRRLVAGRSIDAGVRGRLAACWYPRLAVAAPPRSEVSRRSTADRAAVLEEDALRPGSLNAHHAPDPWCSLPEQPVASPRVGSVGTAG